MKHSSCIRLTGVAALVSVLVACGGSGDSVMAPGTEQLNAFVSQYNAGVALLASGQASTNFAGLLDDIFLDDGVGKQQVRDHLAADDRVRGTALLALLYPMVLMFEQAGEVKVMLSVGSH